MKLFFIIFFISISIGSVIDLSSINTDNQTHADKWIHFLSYFILLITGHISKIFSDNKKFILMLIIYSIFLETFQFFLPYRKFSILDILANLAGIMLGQLVVKKLNFFRNYH